MSVVVEDRPERADHPRAHVGMAAHLGPLPRIQRTRLAEDLLGDPDLADVVEQAAEEEVVVVGELGVDQLGEGDGGLGDRGQMAAGDDVLGLHRGGEAGDHRVVAGARVVEQLAVALDDRADDVAVDYAAALEPGRHRVAQPRRRARRAGRRRAHPAPAPPARRRDRCARPSPAPAGPRNCGAAAGRCPARRCRGRRAPRSPDRRRGRPGAPRPGRPPRARAPPLGAAPAGDARRHDPRCRRRPGGSELP